MLTRLPLHDIPMLVSSINMMLRDSQFESLDDLCAYYDVDRAEIDRLLDSQGYSYDESLGAVR